MVQLIPRRSVFSRSFSVLFPLQSYWNWARQQVNCCLSRWPKFIGRSEIIMIRQRRHNNLRAHASPLKTYMPTQTLQKTSVVPLSNVSNWSSYMRQESSTDAMEKANREKMDLFLYSFLLGRNSAYGLMILYCVNIYLRLRRRVCDLIRKVQYLCLRRAFAG